MDIRIVFSDVDGTLLDSRRRIPEDTKAAVRILSKRGIPFVPVSGRGPSGIFPILEEGGFISPVICCNGSLILGADRRVLRSDGFSDEEASAIADRIGRLFPDVCLNLYTQDRWLTPDRSDPRAVWQEETVHAAAEEGGAEALVPGDVVNKLYCICDPERLPLLAEDLEKAFPDVSAIPSTSTELEIMRRGITKGSAVRALCGFMSIDPCEAAAFGDYWNDETMLDAVGTPVVMGNAPAELKARYPFVTPGNDEGGIPYALKKLGLIP